MNSVEWNVLKRDIEEWCKSSEGKEMLTNAVDKYMLGRVSVQERNLPCITKLAHILVQTLNKEIIASEGENYSQGDLGSSAVAALSLLGNSTPYKNGDKYYVDIYFMKDLHRESLYSEGYPEGALNIAAILNKGINSSKDTPVRGEWHNDYIYGLLKREGAHFIERAVNDFIENYPYAEVEIKEEYI